jgi:hypothetical protein
VSEWMWYPRIVFGLLVGGAFALPWLLFVKWIGLMPSSVTLEIVITLALVLLGCYLWGVVYARIRDR